VSEIFATRSNWLLHVGKLQGDEVLTIHPRGDLTVRKIAEAMAAQKILYARPGQPAFRIIEHGTKIFIQREAA
jgi:hypothetical protein